MFTTFSNNHIPRTKKIEGPILRRFEKNSQNGSRCDSSFIDEIVRDLIRLGALNIDSAGRIAITDLGRECYARSEIPSASRKQKISLCFDPVRHEFVDRPLSARGDQSHSGNEGKNFQTAVKDLCFADVNRIDLDTIRRVAASQRLLSSEDAFICDAEPDETEPGIQICPREFYLFVFLDDDGRIYLRAHEPSSESATMWFQGALDERLVQRHIDFSHLLGPLAANAEDGADTNGNLDGLCPIPVHRVRERIISAVDEAAESISMQTRGLGASGNGNVEGLSQAIERAAERGVRCRLLWAGTETNRYVPLHDNVEHRSTPTTGTEFLVCGNNKVLAASVSQLKLPTGDPATRVLMAGESEESFIHRRLRQHFANRWQVSEPGSCTDAVVETVSQKQDGQTAGTATAKAVQARKEMQS